MELLLSQAPIRGLILKYLADDTCWMTLGCSSHRIRELILADGSIELGLLLATLPHFRRVFMSKSKPFPPNSAYKSYPISECPAIEYTMSFYRRAKAYDAFVSGRNWMVDRNCIAYDDGMDGMDRVIFYNRCSIIERTYRCIDANLKGIRAVCLYAWMYFKGFIATNRQCLNVLVVYTGIRNSFNAQEDISNFWLDLQISSNNNNLPPYSSRHTKSSKRKASDQITIIDSDGNDSGSNTASAHWSVLSVMSDCFLNLSTTRSSKECHIYFGQQKNVRKIVSLKKSAQGFDLLFLSLISKSHTNAVKDFLVDFKCDLGLTGSEDIIGYNNTTTDNGIPAILLDD